MSSIDQADLPQLPTSNAGPVETPPISDDISDADIASLNRKIASVPAEANDIDVIEKEWVVHLKQVVSQTVENPYLQQDHISKIKAEYMKKRYNKDIKIPGK